MRVRLMSGRAVLFTDAPSVSLCARLREAGFVSANEVIWAGSYDALSMLNLHAALLPPGSPATWPRDFNGPGPETVCVALARLGVQ